jgi:hypothetical protein
MTLPPLPPAEGVNSKIKGGVFGKQVRQEEQDRKDEIERSVQLEREKIFNARTDRGGGGMYSFLVRPFLAEVQINV